ncbi:unnamed protein product [Staurois parvus]|uniref:Uncharacterized protein n=1 Tax=Staurois parvus TaxID=386267 RepID=A0ABN9FIX7_9NEOB|nr:unnamed protein product [Staurois parvus]
MGPCTASQPAAQSPSPHSAMCHIQVSSHTVGVFNFLTLGCWQITGSHTAARPLICHRPLYTASSCCCQEPRVSMGPCTASIRCWISIATLCHVPTFRSPHTHCWFRLCSIF